MILPVIVEHVTIFKLTRWNRPTPPTREELEAALRSEGLEPQHWVDPAGTRRPIHSHAHAEVRWLVHGEVHLGLPGLQQELVLRAGDRIDIPAGTPHWAHVVGRGNAAYLWVWRPGGRSPSATPDLSAIIEP